MKKNKAIYYQLHFLTMICLLFIVSCGGQSNQYSEKQEKNTVLEKTLEKDSKKLDYIPISTVQEQDHKMDKVSTSQEEKIKNINEKEEAENPTEINEVVRFKKIRPLPDHTERYYDKIDFWDESTNSLIKTIDIVALNPFNNLPFKVFNTRYECNNYDIKGVSKNQLEKYFGAWENSKNLEDKNPTVLIGDRFVYHHTYLSLADYHSDSIGGHKVVYDYPADNNILINYRLYMLNRHNDAIAIISNIIAYDKKGNLLGQFQTNKSGNYSVITQDGKYIGINYGGTYSIDHRIPTGFAIYNVKSGEKILDEPYIGDVGISIGYDKLVVTGNSSSGGRNYWVYDIEKEKKYLITVFENKLKNTLLWQKNGAISTINGIRREYLYEKDFKSIPIKIKKL